jgi:lipopolysaccharide export system protein LptA
MGIRVGASLTKTSILFVCFCLLFFQAVIFVPDTCAQAPAPATPQASAPVDIQAAEQDFADDQVIAKGNVRVKYKDSLILAPQATLFRDAQGQPQKAIFIGHPNLTNADSTMNADTLIFEIANSKIVAQGHAHSEVISKGDTDMDVTPKSAPKGKNSAKQPFRWPQQGDDTTAKGEGHEDGATATNSDSGASDSGTAAGDSDSSHSDKAKTAKKNTDKNGPPEKIITDSEIQAYDKQSGHFEASGHVHVTHTDMSVYAEKLHLVYGTDGKPETALFTGHVNAFQGKNNTQADMMTYYLATKRLQATGNVHSKVIQEKPPESKDGKKTNGTTASKKTIVGQAPGPGAASAAAPASSGSAKKMADDDEVLVVSDAQDYSKETGLMTADGNVRVYYQDTIGMGPKAVMIRTPEGQAQKVIFSGRSQITQPGKRWIADKITFTCATKKVLAEGNTRAFILQQNQTDSKHSSTSTGLASKPNSANTLSTSKIEATR